MDNFTEKQALLQRLSDLGLFSPVDLHFASFLVRQSKRPSYPLYLAAALLSRAVVAGKHICLKLDSMAGSLLSAFPDLTSFPLDVRLEIIRLLPDLPVPERWADELTASGVVAGPDGYAPLILHGDLLYLQRYWSYEKRLAAIIRARSGKVSPTALEPGRLLEISPRFRSFARENPGELNWQAVAAFAALRNRFTVITGGPGTGKTTVVAALLGLYREAFPSCRVALVAPTGKAQARLGEALRSEAVVLECDDAVKTWLSGLETSTIHRLLGVKYGSPDFRHNRDNPLELDLLVVDEASMVSLALMTRLLEALPDSASVVLLGDRDQLASVEAGAVLSSICAAGDATAFSPDFAAALASAAGPALPSLPVALSALGTDDAIVALRRNYRFASDRGIAVVKEAIGALGNDPAPAQVQEVLRLMENDPTGEVKSMPLPDYSDGSLDRAITRLVLQQQVGDGRPFRDYLRAASVAEAFKLFDGFRILCSHRGGPYGVVNINRLVEKALRLGHGDAFYPGMPVMVTENDYLLKLYNGDVGLLWPDPESRGALRAFFPDYAAGKDHFRCFSPYQLPPFEKVFALTVHKSQGSGFGRILMLVPDLDNSPVLTRELIYTGLTRAMRQAELWYRPRSLGAALVRCTERASDLCRAIAAAPDCCHRFV